MTDRPSILSARTHRLAHVSVCREDLAEMDQLNRPNEASLDEVRAAASGAFDDVDDVGGSVAAVQDVDCPCVRLGADGCLHGGN